MHINHHQRVFSTKCTCKELKKNAKSKLPKPKNAFIIFRQYHHNFLPPSVPTVEKSKIIAAEWRQLAAEDKAYWFELAAREKDIHKEKQMELEHKRLRNLNSTNPYTMDLCEFCQRTANQLPPFKQLPTALYNEDPQRQQWALPSRDQSYHSTPEMVPALLPFNENYNLITQRHMMMPNLPHYNTQPPYLSTTIGCPAPHTIPTQNGIVPVPLGGPQIIYGQPTTPWKHYAKPNIYTPSNTMSLNIEDKS